MFSVVQKATSGIKWVQYQKSVNATYQHIKHNLKTNSDKQNRVKIKQQRKSIKLVNTKHSTHYSQTVIMGTVTIVKVKGYNKDVSHFLKFIRNKKKKKQSNID